MTPVMLPMFPSITPWFGACKLTNKQAKSKRPRRAGVFYFLLACLTIKWYLLAVFFKEAPQSFFTTLYYHLEIY
jgi:hypothetical protein